jgi:predicted metal-dependent hydrolase
VLLFKYRVWNYYRNEGWIIKKKEKIQCMLIGSIEIGIVLKDIKNMHLRVLPSDGKVKISAPNRMDIETIRKFVLQKLDWIEKNQAKFLQQKKEASHEYINGENHYFAGRSYQLRVIDYSGSPKVMIHDQKCIDLLVTKDSDWEKRKKVINDWYREQLKLKIPELIKKWEKIIGVEAQEWRIKQMKTRWGSCSIKPRRIWLNLKLAKKPEYCLEYVIVLELVHLLEPRHNYRFKAYLDGFMPQWRRYKKELNQGDESLLLGT